MKKKQIKKLSLGKQTITALNQDMSDVRGGAITDVSCTCPIPTEYIYGCPSPSNTCTINVVTCVPDRTECGLGDTTPYAGGNCM